MHSMKPYVNRQGNGCSLRGYLHLHKHKADMAVVTVFITGKNVFLEGKKSLLKNSKKKNSTVLINMQISLFLW